MAVEVFINGQAGTTAPGTTLFERAQRGGVAIPSSCARQGRCRECLVDVTEGMALLSPRDRAEQHLSGGYRLACRARVAHEAGRVRCHTHRRGRLHVERRAPMPGELVPDPAVTRSGDRVFVDGLEVARSAAGVRGLAVDLGTTTVVLRLLDLETGEQLAESAFENPQRFGGSDVMTRIRYDSEHPGKHLRLVLARSLGRAIRELPVDPVTIFEVVVVGNPAMRDLFFRQDVGSIGKSPYRSRSELAVAAGRRPSTSLTLTGRRSLLPVHPAARVYGAPVIGGLVGADAAACLLAVNAASAEEPIAVIDIGTNTELMLGDREQLMAAACPAGPALEGGRITCGMPALEGAIDGLRRNEDGSWQLRTVGGAPPEGICGAGLVELLSELRRSGLMNELGRFPATHSEGVRRPRAQARVMLTGDVFVTEQDITELAQAKAVTAAGLQVVCGAYGVTFDQVGAYYLAGAIGRRLNVAAAVRIGLLPQVPAERFRQIGNAAIDGATLALLSRGRRRELEQLVRRVEHVRLEADPRFFDSFVECCRFRPLTLTPASPEC